MASQVVVFQVGNERYAVPIGQVREVVAWSRPTPLPESPPHVNGVLSLRGEVIPVVDLGSRFGGGRAHADEESRVMVVEIDGRSAGMVVDAVTEVISLEEAAVKPAAAVVHNPNDPLVTGIAHHGEELVILVDLARVVGEGQAAMAEGGQTANPAGR